MIPVNGISLISIKATLPTFSSEFSALKSLHFCVIIGYKILLFESPIHLRFGPIFLMQFLVRGRRKPAALGLQSDRIRGGAVEVSNPAAHRTNRPTTHVQVVVDLL